MPNGDAQPDDAKADKSDSPPWIERTVGELLRLMGGTIATFLRLFYLPWHAPVVASQKRPPAPPLSFLIVCILFTGVVVETFVLYYGRPVEHGLTSLLADAIVELGPTEITLLTLPLVALVLLAGGLLSWWTTPSQPRFDNPVSRGVCFAAGVQALILAMFFLGLMLSKWVRDHERVANQYLEPIPLLILLGVLVGSAALQIERVLARRGETFLARYLIFRGPIAFGTSWCLLLGTLIVGSMSFDIFGAVEENSRKSSIAELEQLADELGEERELFVDSLKTQKLPGPDGTVVLRQIVSLSNGHSKPLLVPRPDELYPIELTRKVCDQPFEIQTCSVDLSGDAGWVVEPGKVRLVEWTIQVPEQLAEHGRAGATLEYYELNTADNGAIYYSPIGESSRAPYAFGWGSTNAGADDDGFEQTADRATPALVR